MIHIPPGSKASLNIGSPKQAMEYAQKEGFIGRMEFTFNLKTVHLFWRHGKPVGAIMMPKFGMDATYGRDVVDGMPELIKTVLKIGLFTYDEADLLGIMEKHPKAAFVEQVIEVNDIPKFLDSADDKTKKLLKMMLFSKGELNIDSMGIAFTMPPLADYTKEEFDEAFSNLLKARIISTDGVVAMMPKYIHLITKNEIINDIIERGELRDVLKEEDPFIKEFFEVFKKSGGAVSYREFKKRYKDSKEKYRIFEIGDTLLERDILIEGIDEKGETLYVMPVKILKNLEKIKADKVDVKVSREELRKQLMEKFKMREPDRNQIKNIVNKFYED
ncbi:MAG: hypothetical protein ACE5HH_01065 [Candidatus Hydrothermarchaeales archaeon]